MRTGSAVPIALAILLIAAASIVSAWIFEARGYAPCELCLEERIPYYIGVPLSGLALYAAVAERARLLGAVFVALVLVFAASACFGAYHAGVEWGFWPGPKDCSGSLARASSVQTFLAELQRVKVARCDDAALRIIGLSLAGWNALISAGLALLALIGAWDGMRSRKRDAGFAPASRA